MVGRVRVPRGSSARSARSARRRASSSTRRPPLARPVGLSSSLRDRRGRRGRLVGFVTSRPAAARPSFFGEHDLAALSTLAAGHRARAAPRAPRRRGAARERRASSPVPRDRCSGGSLASLHRPVPRGVVVLIARRAARLLSRSGRWSSPLGSPRVATAGTLAQGTAAGFLQQWFGTPAADSRAQTPPAGASG